jgi:hypothetical protein
VAGKGEEVTNYFCRAFWQLDLGLNPLIFIALHRKVRLEFPGKQIAVSMLPDDGLFVVWIDKLESKGGDRAATQVAQQVNP